MIALCIFTGLRPSALPIELAALRSTLCICTSVQVRPVGVPDRVLDESVGNCAGSLTEISNSSQCSPSLTPRIFPRCAKWNLTDLGPTAMMLMNDRMTLCQLSDAKHIHLFFTRSWLLTILQEAIPTCPDNPLCLLQTPLPPA